MTSIRLPEAKVLLLLVVLISPAAAQQNGRDTAKTPPKRPRVFTNDDLQGDSSPSGDGLPEIPGLIKCGKDLNCFLQALDSATPAAVTRNETAEMGTGVVTSNSIWWTTQYTADRCTVSFRVDAFEAKVNEKVVHDSPPATRDEAEGKIADMNRDFAPIRGKTETCNLPVKNLRALMISPYWTLMTLGPASNSGKNCSGPLFDTPHGPLQNDKK